jgi:hypothetical protein
MYLDDLLQKQKTKKRTICRETDFNINTNVLFSFLCIYKNDKRMVVVVVCVFGGAGGGTNTFIKNK